MFFSFFLAIVIRLNCTMNKSIFKAYDIRGRYPDELNEEDVLLITAALGRKWCGNKPKNKNQKLKVVVGHDARLSSSRLYKVAYGGLTISLFENQIIDAGLITTPMLYFLVNHFNAVGGIMITASHNPKEYNGIKVVGKNAVPISGQEIQRLVL